VISEYKSNDGRSILLNVKLNNHPYTLVCVYAPNILKQRIEFFVRLKHWIQKHCLNDDYLIIGGDLNCCESQIDKTTTLKEQSQYFKEFKETVKVIDTWRNTYPSKVQFTYHNPGTQTYGSRIDYILASKLLTNNICLSEIYPAPVSDHDAVITSFKIENRKRGMGYWKLNTSVLNEEDYKEGIRELLKEAVREYNTYAPIDSREGDLLFTLLPKEGADLNNTLDRLNLKDEWTIISPKDILFPQLETMFTFDKERIKEQVEVGYFVEFNKHRL